MNCFRIKIILYMLIMAAKMDFTLCWPICHFKDVSIVQQHQLPDLSGTRSSRQVVQPSWLNFGGDPVIDPKVHVNPEALREAEEVRKTIQKAVKEDTFVVTADQQDQNNAMKTTLITPPNREPNTTHPMHSLPNWYIQLKKLWLNLFKGFLN